MIDICSTAGKDDPHASGGADVDHILHPPGDLLLHLEGHGQRLSHPAPGVSLLDRLDWTRSKEVIVCRTPHAKIVDESLGMFPLLIGVAPEEVRYLRQVHRVL